MSQQQHTPEPWGLNDKRSNGWMDNAMFVSGNDGSNIVRCYSDFGNEEANARRIVACVNACAGIPNEVLSAVGAFGGFSRDDMVQHVTKQRDMLIEALEHLYLDFERTREWGCLPISMVKARSAIASVKETK